MQRCACANGPWKLDLAFMNDNLLQPTSPDPPSFVASSEVLRPARLAVSSDIDKGDPKLFQISNECFVPFPHS